MSSQPVKQQIVDKLKEVDTVLIAVSSNPSVDELSAALGFTMLLNKMNKHATSVFSGDIPPAIKFLDPHKTFENSVDSLRDFIIGLDKEKADHLRYKVEGDMVKIFITPYKTTVDETDLEYSQGDYNVEMVVALGVKSTDDLDRALADHGRIMHDAAVASLSIGEGSSQLGSMNWHEADASCYSELLVGLSEALRDDKNLIDERIATAFLTGIVAATDRFSNDKTSSKSMTVAAQLMAAGANQQLIATKLEEGSEIAVQPPVKDDVQRRSDGTIKLDKDVMSKVDHQQSPKKPKKGDNRGQPKEDAASTVPGSMKITHEEGVEPNDEKVDPSSPVSPQAEDALAESLAATTDKISKNIPSVEDIQNDLRRAADTANNDDDAANPELPPLARNDEASQPTTADDGSQPSSPAEAPAPTETPPEPPLADDLQGTAVDGLQFEPTFGGTLNATSEQAAADKRREEAANHNRTILSHDSEPATYVSGQPSDYPAVNSHSQTTEPSNDPSLPMLPPTVSSRGKDLQPSSSQAQLPPSQPSPSFQTLEEIDRQNRSGSPQIEQAQAAIDEALNNAPPQQSASGLPDLAPLDSAPSPLGVTEAPLPPMPDFSTLPPLPSAPGLPLEPTPDQAPVDLQNGLPTVSPVNVAPQAQAPQTPPDPGQFKIPGQ